jgi:XTP/dITP diphosphohydrolase
VFHARIAEEHEAPWSIDDVAAGIVDKLVSRHPHVFGDVSAADAAEVERNWAALKAAEKGRESLTDGVPQALPALVLAAKLLSRTKTLGLAAVDAGTAKTVGDAVAEVTRSRVLAGGTVEQGYGDLLLAVVAAARADGVDAEQALRESARAYRAQVRESEGLT